MTNVMLDRPARGPLRLWPGVVIVVLQWLARFVMPALFPGTGIYAVLAGAAGGLAVVLWWLFFSRAPWSERLGAVVLMIAAVPVTLRVVHKSIAGGMMGMMLPIFIIPVLSLALVVWAVASRRMSNGPRRVWLVAAIVLACGVFTLIRTGGMTAAGESDFHWRWTETPEDRLLAQAAGERAAVAPAPAADNAGAEWPGFRGPQRNGVVSGVRIATDWAASPPVEAWRREVGPGWSSFAVQGGLMYTQEQRGDDEVVSCYQLATGQPVWSHRDAVRFYESNAGAGPRATPTLGNGRVFTLGATGLVNALDAGTGAVAWSHNAASDTGKKVPGWGFSSSPLLVDDMVVIATAGTLVAYDAATGGKRWVGTGSGWGYSSPHLATIAGVQQVLLLNGEGVVSLAPADGAQLWEHKWPGDGIVQPGFTSDGDLLIGSGSGMSVGVGVRRIAVTHGPGGWSTEDRWTSTGLKPYFNDFVVHKDHAYGFDGALLSCIDLKDGQRKWKGGRYGQGQMILLSDQDALLVLGEQGELALVAAAPDQFKELARFPGLQGKTWNHPVLAGGLLLVRNDHEMAAFRLAAGAVSASLPPPGSRP